MRGPTVIPRAEIERDTAQRQAFAPPRNQIREAASMAGEIVGTEPLARGVMALRGDLTGRPEPGRAAGEFGMAAVNLGLGALGLADDVATVRAARPLPPSMRASAEIAPRPTPPPRQIGRASDGSVLPVREPQPFRQSLVGGSDDLREAARLNNRPDRVTRVYHGTSADADFAVPGNPQRPDEMVSASYDPTQFGYGNRTIPLDVRGRIATEAETAEIWRQLRKGQSIEEALRERGFVGFDYNDGHGVHPVIVDRSAMRNAITGEGYVGEATGNRPPPPGSGGVGADMRRPLFPGRRK
jgi:hypothetical protein